MTINTTFVFDHLHLTLAEVQNHELNAVGWAVMLVSVGSVLTLAGFCIYKVLSLPPVEDEHLKGPLEIDTRDTGNND